MLYQAVFKILYVSFRSFNLYSLKYMRTASKLHLQYAQGVFLLLSYQFALLTRGGMITFTTSIFMVS